MNKLSTSLIGSLRTYCRFRNVKMLNKRTYVTTSRYLWEPPGLKTEPDIPEFEAVNVKLLGYDFPVLENFQKYAKNMAATLDLQNDGWTVPPTITDIDILQFKKVKVIDAYTLHEYQRIVQVKNVQSTQLFMLLEILKANCPVGVKIEVAKHSEDDIEFLYIPNYEIQNYETTLAELDERKKWM